MSGPLAAQPVRPPVGLLLAWLPGVAALVTALAASISVLTGEGDVLAVLAAGTAVVLSSVLTPGALAAMGPIDATRIAPMTVTLSSARLALGTALAFGLWMLVGRSDLLPFWITFLLASLVTLVVESLVMIAAIRRATMAPTGAPANGGAVT
ncbi:MAG: hypothetical protein KF866_00420 [Phycisphaeraceae bacterium]|nr:hypothetical protein [Phycisphaeraceae bacterium]MCW5753614.1 hypothetical protein [Phycisphaeraceae bacterium]